MSWGINKYRSNMEQKKGKNNFPVSVKAADLFFNTNIFSKQIMRPLWVVQKSIVSMRLLGKLKKNVQS